MSSSSVAPEGCQDPQSAFADALTRARQIAAKLAQPGDCEPVKRAHEGEEEGEPEAKRNTPFAEVQQRATQASQAAAAAAAQINAKLGLAANPSPAPPVPVQLPTGMAAGSFGAPAGMGMVTTEEYRVPDRMVGFIIGKGGEQIAGIQAQTGCKVQFAPDSGGRPERPCSLTGTPEAIAQAKAMVDEIVTKANGIHGGHGGPQESGLTTLEVQVPGNKAGLVIGRGGETIKSLQEQAGVKMVMIQDSKAPSHEMKPLKITGELSKCQKARDMVMELIGDRNGGPMPRGMGGPGGGGPGGPGGGGPGGHHGGEEVPVPRNLVGVVIGKGGEMIKKIQADTGARVQFKPDDGGGPDMMCNITGGPDQVQSAMAMIQDLVENAMQRQNGPGGMGGGGGRGRGPNMNDGHGGGSFGGGDGTMMNVPTEKCGIIIGKGGESIRELIAITGAHVELCRQPPPGTDPGERVFKLQGNPDQVQHAMRLMAEKVGIPPPNEGGGPQGGPGGFPGQGPPGQGPPGGFNQFGQFGGQQQQAPQHRQSPAAPGYAPQGWSNNYDQGNQNASPAPNMPQASDPNAAAWAAYYQNYYNQGQQQPQQQQPAQPQQQQQLHAAPAQQQQQQPAQATVNPQTGQPDYTAAWVEYYRQQGMVGQAQAIMSQAGANQQTQYPQ